MTTGFEEEFDFTIPFPRVSVSDQVRSSPPGPVDVPAPDPSTSWFARQFEAAGTTVTGALRSAGRSVMDAMAVVGTGAGNVIGGTLSAAFRPLLPLLIMVAVVGVIAFLILGRVQR